MTKDMIVETTSVLEARALAELVALASKFSSNIIVTMDEKKVNMKSIMGMLGLGLDTGKTICIEALGEDEAEALTAIEKFLRS